MGQLQANHRLERVLDITYNSYAISVMSSFNNYNKLIIISHYL